MFIGVLRVNYYNEIDPRAAAWLRELIKAGLIPAGDVDERSITDVSASDLSGFTQCHFFAGIGGWSLALQLAGWPEDRPVWTGSCPCQPFSAAGKGLGEKDPRHLWPEFRRLIAECSPPVVFGEQVASKDGREWLTGVRADLEALAYAVGAADLCAAGVGSPHIRQRLFWVADASNGGCAQHGDKSRRRKQKGPQHAAERDCSGRMGDAHGAGQREQCGPVAVPKKLPAVELRGDACDCGMDNPGSFGRREVRDDDAEHDRIITPAARNAGWMEEPDSRGCQDAREQPGDGRQEVSDWKTDQSGSGGAWSDFDIIPCRDGKARRVESGSFPLVAGLPRGVVPSCDISPAYAQATAEGRVARLRGYGNSIVPQVAAEFIAAYQEAIEEVTP